MQQTSKGTFIGGVLLIVGISIGGGMLALPVANAATGFPVSSLFLLVCWLVMTFSAFLILEVNLWLPPGSNMISMARTTLGKPGAWFAWLTYLFLLYALLAAYIAGGTDVLSGLSKMAGFRLPAWLASLLFTSILGFVVYLGIKSVDYVNTGLMFGKLGVYFILVVLIMPHVRLSYLQGETANYALGSLMVLIASFGFAIIVPSLRSYFHDDVKQIRRVIVWGSLIPLIFYVLWDAVIIGVIPRFGPDSLTGMLHSGHSTTELHQALSRELNNIWISDFFGFFSSICMLTAFLGVSLSLSDFFADGLKLKKNGKESLIVYAATFLPPLLIVLFDPDIFIKSFNYAGIFVVLLLILLPNLMTFSGRYIKKINGKYRVKGGMASIIIATIIALALVYIGYSHLRI